MSGFSILSSSDPTPSTLAPAPALLPVGDLVFMPLSLVTAAGELRCRLAAALLAAALLDLVSDSLRRLAGGGVSGVRVSGGRRCLFHSLSQIRR